MDVKGKITVITGASAGIGLQTARVFAENGARLVLAARSVDKLTELSKELSAKGCENLVIRTDMRDHNSVANLIGKSYEWKSRIDILINNAGQAAAGRVEDISTENFRSIIDLNVFGPLYAIQYVVPLMKKNGGGMIINISSSVTKMNIPGLGAYAATKTALSKLSDTARVELAGDNIKVITFYPRATSTDFGKNALGNRERPAYQRPASPDYIVDTPEAVALKILSAAVNEPHEQFME